MGGIVAGVVLVGINLQRIQRPVPDQSQIPAQAPRQEIRVKIAPVADFRIFYQLLPLAVDIQAKPHFFLLQLIEERALFMDQVAGKSKLRLRP